MARWRDDLDLPGSRRIVHRGLPDKQCGETQEEDRKSTRLNSSHLVISYAVFCLKKKKQTTFLTAQAADAIGGVKDMSFVSTRPAPAIDTGTFVLSRFSMAFGIRARSPAARPQTV